MGACHSWVRGSRGAVEEVGERVLREGRELSWEACRGQAGGRFQNKDVGSGVGRDLRFRVGEEAPGRRAWGSRTGTSPSTAAAVCGRAGVCQKGAEEGRPEPWTWGQWVSTARLCFRVGFSATAPAPRGPPGPPAWPPHSCPQQSSAGSPSWEGGVRRHVAWASLPGGKQSLGTRLGLRLVPPSDSGGGAAVGARCGRGPATSLPSARGSHPHLFLRPCPGWRRAAVLPREAEGLWAPSALLCWQMQEN